MSCSSSGFPAQSPVHPVRQSALQFARHHSCFPRTVLTVLSLFPLEKKNPNWKALATYRNVSELDYRCGMTVTQYFLAACGGSGFFSGPLQGGSLPRRPHPHCTRSVSSWLAPLHSINLREHRNASRWQTQPVPNPGLQPRRPCMTWGYSKMFAWQSDGLLTDSALLLVAALWVSGPTTFSLRLQIQNADNKSITCKGLSSGPNATPHTTLSAPTWHSKCSTAKHCDNRFLSSSWKARCSLPIIRFLVLTSTQDHFASTSSIPQIT